MQFDEMSKQKNESRNGKINLFFMKKKIMIKKHHWKDDRKKGSYDIVILKREPWKLIVEWTDY